MVATCTGNRYESNWQQNIAVCLILDESILIVLALVDDMCCTPLAHAFVALHR